LSHGRALLVEDLGERERGGEAHLGIDGSENSLPSSSVLPGDERGVERAGMVEAARAQAELCERRGGAHGGTGSMSRGSTSLAIAWSPSFAERLGGRGADRRDPDVGERARRGSGRAASAAI
jgi:hypothetical protein